MISVVRPVDVRRLADTWGMLRKNVNRGDPAASEWAAIEQHTPNGLLDEVETYGVQMVWTASIEALGFPFTWATTGPEFTAIREHLKQKG